MTEAHLIKPLVQYREVSRVVSFPYNFTYTLSNSRSTILTNRMSLSQRHAAKMAMS